MPGEAIDIGVFGGSGIGCLGARGERGIAGNAPIPLGDNGGDAILEEDCESPSRGFRGSGVCIPPIGLGLEGSPGLIGGGEMKVRVIVSCCGSELLDEFKMPAKEPALESGGDRCLSRMSGGLICTACRMAGKGS